MQIISDNKMIIIVCFFSHSFYYVVPPRILSVFVCSLSAHLSQLELKKGSSNYVVSELGGVISHSVILLFFGHMLSEISVGTNY